jgi:hypothetical protein
MPEVKMTAVCKVPIVERERGWGQKTLETKYFDSWEDAKKFVNKYNSDLEPGPAPDYYIQAEGPYGI